MEGRSNTIDWLFIQINARGIKVYEFKVDAICLYKDSFVEAFKTLETKHLDSRANIILLLTHPDRATEIAASLVLLQQENALTLKSREHVTKLFGMQLCKAFIRLRNENFTEEFIDHIIAKEIYDEDIINFIILLKEKNISEEIILKSKFYYSHHFAAYYKAVRELQENDITDKESIEAVLEVGSDSAEIMAQSQIKLHKENILNKLSRETLLINPRIAKFLTSEILILLQTKKMLTDELYETLKVVVAKLQKSQCDQIYQLLQEKILSRIDEHNQILLCKIILLKTQVANELLKFLTVIKDKNLIDEKALTEICELILTNSQHHDLQPQVEKLKTINIENETSESFQKLVTETLKVSNSSRNSQLPANVRVSQSCGIFCRPRRDNTQEEPRYDHCLIL